MTNNPIIDLKALDSSINLNELVDTVLDYQSLTTVSPLHTIYTTLDKMTAVLTSAVLLTLHTTRHLHTNRRRSSLRRR